MNTPFKPPHPAAKSGDAALTRNALGIAAEAERFAARYGADRQRRVLIVGGAGYIGGPVATELLRNGVAVTNLDLLVYNHQSAMMGALPHPDYDFVFGDMGNPDDLDRALENVTDVVILGGLVGDPITKKFPAEAHKVNDVAVEKCIDHLNGKGLNKVIFVSTCSNYGMMDEGTLAREDSPLKPLSLYAESKVAIEKHLLSLEGKVDFAPTILRFATAFGLAPRMRFDLTVNEFTRELALDKELLVYDADTWRPYCHVSDFGRLIRHVLEFPVDEVAFEVFNAGSDANNHTKQSIVDLVLTRLPDRNVAYKSNSTDPRNYRVSFQKLHDKLGFECRYTVEDGIDEILWALEAHLLDEVEERRSFFGNYELTRS
ncbi:NAD-dependent epimerase/dehydratase family protein [Rhodobium gokarnense]|uniref:Nucleoside-diphosphate-sugar epimerase n=1 Tax=Rhodobium gokarnense TaxID=364296 RepID=A0ABT3HHT1_9HYPH|nr:NAD(P)-dependent oxidoreductase [Rhodobium gokarnense]MCW2309947.1 nucleoside-diphosphate-sugar epimerase [Rhodobium gokarnense]